MPIYERVSEQQQECLKQKNKRSKQPNTHLNVEQVAKYVYQKVFTFQKIVSLFWTAFAIALIYFSNFFHNLFFNPQINQQQSIIRLFKNISFFFFSIMTVFIIYTALILNHYYKIKDVEQQNPYLIYIGAISGFFGSLRYPNVISMIIAIWPLWGWMSIFMYFSLIKGFFEVNTLFPQGKIGQVLFFVVIACSLLSFYLIQHKGYMH